MEPLPKELPEDLNEIKTLIDGRLEARKGHEVSYQNALTAMEDIDIEVKRLRDHAQVLLGTKPSGSERSVKLTSVEKEAQKEKKQKDDK